MLPLAAFYSALSLIVIFLVVGATSLYLERKRLYTVADGAALAAAEAFDLDDVTVVAGEVRPHLRSDEVRAAVEGYLAELPEAGLGELAIDEASSADGLTATVTLSAIWRPPLLTPLLPDGVPIDVTSVARSVFS